MWIEEQIKRRERRFKELTRYLPNHHLWEHERDYHKYLTSFEWDYMRDFVRDRDYGKCVICGKSKSKMACHHWRYPDGKSYIDDTSENIILLCQNCHKKHHEMLGAATSSFRSAKEAVRAHQDHYGMGRIDYLESFRVLTIREAKDTLWQRKRERELRESQKKNFNQTVKRHAMEHLEKLKVDAAGGATVYLVKQFLDFVLALILIPVFFVWLPISIILAMVGIELPELPSIFGEEIRLPDEKAPNKFVYLKSENGTEFYYGYFRYGRWFTVTEARATIAEAYHEALEKFGEDRVEEPPNRFETGDCVS